jgi:membrane protease YdiL (CAAX protease family)
MTSSARSTALISLLAAALFGPLLALRRLGPLDFWWGMSLSIVILVSLGYMKDASYRASTRLDWREGVARKIGLGLATALLLYGIFWAGGSLSRAALPSAGKEIAAVYSFKQEASAIRMGLLIVLIIGPGEELFWRGFVQRRWESSLGRTSGWLAAAAFYAAVHAGSGNFMLVLAALVCGLFWGALYSWSRSVLLVAVSHTVWDGLVFLLFPLG